MCNPFVHKGKIHSEYNRKIYIKLNWMNIFKMTRFNSIYIWFHGTSFNDFIYKSQSCSNNTEWILSQRDCTQNEYPAKLCELGWSVDFHKKILQIIWILARNWKVLFKVSSRSVQQRWICSSFVLSVTVCLQSEGGQDVVLTWGALVAQWRAEVRLPVSADVIIIIVVVVQCV